MRVVVVREYKDKYTGKGHVIGEKLDMTEERFAEIQKRGMFVVDISDEVQQEKPAVPDEQTQEIENEQEKPVTRRSRTKKKSEGEQ